MARELQKTIAVSVNHNRLSLVFFVGKQPFYWEMSYVAAFSTKRAAKKVTRWVEYYDASKVITEDIRGGSRKGRYTQQMLSAIKHALAKNGTQHVQVPRFQPFQSKYEQMDFLCEKYPQLKVLALHKRKYWQNEHPHVSYFEAVAMADHYLQSDKARINEPPENLPV